LYYLTIKHLSRKSEAHDWHVFNSVELPPFTTDYKAGCHGLTQKGQETFKKLLAEYGVGNVFYHVKQADTNARPVFHKHKRELIVHLSEGEQLMHRIELRKEQPYPEQRDCVHFDMGR